MECRSNGSEEFSGWFLILLTLYPDALRPSNTAERSAGSGMGFRRTGLLPGSAGDQTTRDNQVFE